MVRYAVSFAFAFILLFSLSKAQSPEPEWGISFSPFYSKARPVPGFGVGYPGPPFFVGELIVEERTVPGFSIEVLGEKPTSFKNLLLKGSLGFLKCGAFKYYYYDYANSIGNIVSLESRFGYITSSGSAKYSLPISKETSLVAALGLHIGFITSSDEIRIGYNNISGSYYQSSYSVLSGEDHFNYGPVYTFGVRYRRLSLEGIYRSFLKLHANLQDSRRVINYGLTLSYFFKKSEQNR